ncbi:MAG: hypothetical protein A2142_04180 [candidate division Zixibacteria bacterium RBG_16_48_11]|nr:MAG: hypothetical protein A2142_04180 [candidate division Zixibacteria bacterium RBG_16_48_11]
MRLILDYFIIKIMKKLGFILGLAFLLTSLTITTAKGQSINQNQGLKDTLQLKLERKSPSGALFRSLFVPGWGQLYNQKYVKSAVVFLGEGSLIGLVVYEWAQIEKHKDNFMKETDPFLKDLEFQRFQLHEDNRNAYLWFLAGAAFISMWDAYVDAHLYNFKQQTKKLDVMGGLDKEGRIKVGVAWRF